MSKDSAWPAKAAVAQLWLAGCGAPPDFSIKVFSKVGERNASILWRREFQPALVIFDSSDGSDVYDVHIRPGSAATDDWRPKAGVILETRRRADGTAENPQQIMQIWGKSTPVLGRSFVDNIFLGINPHGPNWNFCSKFDGWFETAERGEYQFATISDDASILQIDGKTVSEWGGWHGPWPGARAERAGKITLDKGLHTLSYINVQNGSEYCVAVAWWPPGKPWFEIMPPAVFPKIAQFNQTAVYVKDSEDGIPFPTWNVEWFGTAGGYSIAQVRFEVHGVEQGAAPVWEFEGAGKASGAAVSKLLLSMGKRKVSVRWERKGKSPSTLSFEADIQPDWTQKNQFPVQNIDDSMKSTIAMPPGSLMPRDLRSLLLFAVADERLDIITTFGPEAISKADIILKDGGAELFLKLGFILQHPEIRRYIEARKAFDALWKSDVAQPSLRAQGGLHLASLLLHSQADCVEAGEILSKINPASLSDNDRRLHALFMGDVMRISGNPGGAQQAYRKIQPTATKEGVKRNTLDKFLLQRANEFIARRELDAAWSTLTALEWESPTFRGDPNLQLAMAEVNILRKEWPFASVRCNNVIRNNPRTPQEAKALYGLIQISEGSGDVNAAKDNYQHLIQNHPWSDEAARAKRKWKDKLGQ